MAYRAEENHNIGTFVADITDIWAFLFGHEKYVFLAGTKIHNICNK